MNGTINRKSVSDSLQRNHRSTLRALFRLSHVFFWSRSKVISFQNALVWAKNSAFPPLRCHAAINLMIFAGICLAFRSSGQSAVENQYNELTVRALTESGGMAPVATAFDTRYEGVRGTPLLFETWKVGTIKVKDNEQAITPVKLNINLEKQIAAVCYLNGSIGILPGNRLEYLSFDSSEGPQRFIVLPGNLVDPTRNGDLRFYALLHKGDRFTFLKYISREFRKADYKGAYSTQVRYDEYVEETQYFLRLDEGPYVKVRLRSSAIEKQLSAWQLALPPNSGGAGLDTVEGVVEALKMLEQK